MTLKEGHGKRATEGVDSGDYADSLRNDPDRVLDHFVAALGATDSTFAPVRDT